MRCPTLDELPAPPVGRSGWPWTEDSPALTHMAPGGAPWPTISIITPSYNQAEYIEETIRSVLLQGYPNLEYIVIDGGSTSATLDVIRRYDPWLAHWVSEPDRGQSDAINKGFARATGDVVAWVNSDDALLPQALIRVSEAFVASPNVGLVYGDYLAVDSCGMTLMRRRSPDFDVGALATYNWIAQGFVRSEVVGGAELVSPDLHYLMDWHLWLRIALRSEARRTPHSLARVRFHPTAKTVSSHQGFVAEQRRVLDWLYAQPSLPPAVGAVRSSAYATYEYAMAVEAFDSGCRREAAAWVLRSMRRHVTRPSLARRLAYLGASLLPRRCTDVVRRKLKERRYPIAFLSAIGAGAREGRS